MYTIIFSTTLSLAVSVRSTLASMLSAQKDATVGRRKSGGTNQIAIPRQYRAECQHRRKTRVDRGSWHPCSPTMHVECRGGSRLLPCSTDHPSDLVVYANTIKSRLLIIQKTGSFEYLIKVAVGNACKLMNITSLPFEDSHSKNCGFLVTQMRTKGWLFFTLSMDES